MTYLVGNISWVVGSTAVIVGVPLLLAIEGERQVIEMQNQMSGGGGGGASAGGAPVSVGGLPPGPPVNLPGAPPA